MEKLKKIASHGFLCGALLAPLTGCSLFGNGKLEQCRGESERLLSDYRQQRERAERLEIENRVLNEKIAEVEKELALASKQKDQRLASRPAAPAQDAGDPPSSDVRPEEPATPASPPTTPAEKVDVPPTTDDGWRSVPRS